MPSDPLPAEAQARNAELAQRVEEFLVASIRDWTGRAARMPPGQADELIAGLRSLVDLAAPIQETP